LAAGADSYPSLTGFIYMLAGVSAALKDLVPTGFGAVVAMYRDEDHVLRSRRMTYPQPGLFLVNEQRQLTSPIFLAFNQRYMVASLTR
jgi:hypothetical protein